MIFWFIANLALKMLKKCIWTKMNFSYFFSVFLFSFHLFTFSVLLHILSFVSLIHFDRFYTRMIIKNKNEKHSTFYSSWINFLFSFRFKCFFLLNVKTVRRLALIFIVIRNFFSYFFFLFCLIFLFIVIVSWWNLCIALLCV